MVLIFVDVFLGRLQRKVRRMERGVEEEGIGCMFAGVLLEESDSVVGDRGRTIEARFRLRESHAVEQMVVLGEEAKFIQHGVGMVESSAARACHMLQMPFAGVIAAVAKRL